MDQITLQNEYTRIKRKLFDTYFAFLNEKQREAVYTTEGPLLILAGAGSGKTTVLVNRLAYIVRYGNAYKSDYVPGGTDERTLDEMKAAISLPRDELGAFLCRFAVFPPPAWSVMAITFTNKAANEIKDRVGKIFGDDSSEANEIWTGTFHSVCMRLLRKYTAESGYLPGFGVCDADDSKKVCKECLKDLNIDEKQLPIKTVLNKIGRAKDQLMSPEDFKADAGQDIKLRQIAEVYEVYQRRLKEANLLDFDDIIMQTVLLLQNNEAVRNALQTRFRYVSVDEYQDTNKAQLVLTLLLSGKYNNIMVVGDDDQSIYKFRGATIENILSFDKKIKDTAVIKLEENYRSTKTILDAANAVIAHNTERHGKNLWTSGDRGEPISITKLSNQTTEARFIADKIEENMRSGCDFKSFAVLYRTNAQSRSLEQTFAKSGIPYRLLGGLRFFDRQEVKDVLAYLCVVNNPSDDVHLGRIINVPRRGIGDKSIGAARTIALAEGTPLLQVMRRAGQYKAIPAGAAAAMSLLAELFDKYRAKADEVGISELIRFIAEDSGYLQMLVQTGEEGKERIENIEELVSTAAQYEQDADVPSLSGFLEDVALVSDVDKYDETANAVVLMTIHSAKGLEFPIVFLPGMEEGIFPGYQTMYDPEEVEEERRLAYVALTRAKKQIYITHVHDRMLNGSTQMNRPSRFLDEIPSELTDVDDRSGFFSSRGSAGWDEDDDPFAAYAKAATINNAKTTVPQQRPYSAAPSRPAPTISFGVKPAPIRRATQEFNAGDRVHHNTFGDGTVLTTRPMGGDVLYEIAFDSVGTKKLMATYVKLTKI